MASGSEHQSQGQKSEMRSTLRDRLPAENLKGRPIKYPARKPSGTLWPHDEFSLGYYSPRPDDDQRLGEFSYVAPGLGPDGQEVGAPAPLDLSDVPNSHKRAKRGLKGITGYGRQMVKAAGYLQGELFPHHRKTFATVTIPVLPSDQRIALVERWGEFVRQILQWVLRRCERAGVPELVVSVTEIQPERLLETGEGYLHLHLIWLNVPAKAEHWTVHPNDVRTWVERFLTREIKWSGGGHVNVDVKPVKGDAARYLAKYMSKGGQVLAEALEDWGVECCPSTWWNMTARARQAIKDRLIKGDSIGLLLEEMVAYGFNTNPDEVFAFLRHIEIDLDGYLVTVGWRGRLVSGVAVDLRDMVKSAAIVADLQRSQYHRSA